MKIIISILSLFLALNLDKSVIIEKYCGMPGCSMKVSKICYCKMADKESCCTPKYSCSKSEFYGTYKPAVQINIAKQTTAYNPGEITFIPNTIPLLKIENFHLQKFKPDLQLNTPLLI